MKHPLSLAFLADNLFKNKTSLTINTHTANNTKVLQQQEIALKKTIDRIWVSTRLDKEQKM